MKKRFFLMISVVMLLWINVVVFADEEFIPNPQKPVISQADSASSSFSSKARGILQGGDCTIAVEGSKKARLTGTTYGNDICPLIKTTMYLYKYNPTTEEITFVDGPFRFTTTNDYFGHASQVVSVATSGYYFNYTVHSIGTESTTSQTSAIRIPN